ncbi:hypothetical protein SELMODRAFT_93085 [Selaginella moellendorffii]|uniref:Uncharacterized protein n=1 Tax=Selaginella moellendorffii TaxID=88036 RepID=D8RHS5_SELML|nr:hypothetical protein SELMODRAFT_93085 [Selaginella moellendorffii]
MVAIQLMLAQFPKLEQWNLRPFVLRTQLYSSVKDRTTVDKELEALKQQQVVRMFKLNSGRDDFAFSSSFLFLLLAQIDAAKQRMESKHSADTTIVFDWFQNYVLGSSPDLSISNSHLVSLLSRGGKTTDKQISVLINAGFLVRQMSDSEDYWFSIPGIGWAMKNLTQGRKEVTQLLRKRQSKEALLSVLEKRKLRSSSLGMRFHLRDLLGSSVLVSVETTSGALIRLAKR